MTVDPPSSDVGATHVVVGSNVVWALTKDNKVSESLHGYRTIYRFPQLSTDRIYLSSSRIVWFFSLFLLQERNIFTRAKVRCVLS